MYISRYKESIFSFLRRTYQNKSALTGLVIVVLLSLVALLAPIIAPHDPMAQNLTNRLQPGFWAGNWLYPLGTDTLGRDILSRIFYGSRVSLSVGFIAICITAVFGIPIGVVAGYFGGKIDMVIMRFIDIMLAFPALLLALALIGVIGSGLDKAMIAIGVVYIPKMARIVRGSVLEIKERPFIEAARALGANNLWLTVRHILPNILAPIIVFLSLLLADAILYAAALGFLGMGVSIPRNNPFVREA